MAENFILFISSLFAFGIELYTCQKLVFAKIGMNLPKLTENTEWAVQGRKIMIQYKTGKNTNFSVF